METYNACFTTVPILLNSVGRSLSLVNKVWVENVKLVSLYNLWRRVIVIVVSLIVLVPFISSMNPVEILGFSWPILVMPPINLHHTAKKI